MNAKKPKVCLTFLGHCNAVVPHERSLFYKHFEWKFSRRPESIKVTFFIVDGQKGKILRNATPICEIVKYQSCNNLKKARKKQVSVGKPNLGIPSL